MSIKFVMGIPENYYTVYDDATQECVATSIKDDAIALLIDEYQKVHIVRDTANEEE